MRQKKKQSEREYYELDGVRYHRMQIETEIGPAMIVVCDREDCPEGCASRGKKAFGLGRLIEDSKRIMSKGNAGDERSRQLQF